jgi:hypothetical protein
MAKPVTSVEGGYTGDCGFEVIADERLIGFELVTAHYE